MSWETVIGLEIHVQLSTDSKLFSGGSTSFGAEPNTHVDLIDLGLPGVLPVANRGAFHKAIRFGLATNAQINQTSTFDRKNYFCLLYTSPSPRDRSLSRMPSSA